MQGKKKTHYFGCIWGSTPDILMGLNENIRGEAQHSCPKCTLYTVHVRGVYGQG